MDIYHPRFCPPFLVIVHPLTQNQAQIILKLEKLFISKKLLSIQILSNPYEESEEEPEPNDNKVYFCDNGLLTKGDKILSSMCHFRYGVVVGNIEKKHPIYSYFMQNNYLFLREYCLENIDSGHSLPYKCLHNDVIIDRVFLYWINGSIPSMRVFMVLGLKNIPYNHQRLKVMVDPKETQSNKFLKLNPRGKTPVLVCRDGVVMIESYAILNYLEQTNGSLNLLGNLPHEYRIIHQRLQEAENLKKVYSPIERLFKSDTDETKSYAKQSVKNVMMELDHWEKYLGKTKYAALDKISLADCNLYPILRYQVRRGLDLKDYPNVKKYYDMVYHLYSGYIEPYRWTKKVPTNMFNKALSN
jgi:glutathione S-transferase